MKQRDVLAIFNRGRISRLALARTDVARVALSAEEQTNWIPRTLGSMMVRPGMRYRGVVPDNGAYVPFIFSNSDNAILELTPDTMRIWLNGDTLLTRSGTGTSAAITNGNFTSNLNSWTDADDAGAASQWVTGGYMELLGTGYASAKRQQAVSSSGSTAVHSLRIVIERGPLLLRIGTTAGNDNIFRQAVLRTGAHSIAFVPNAATFYIEFSSSLKYPVMVNSCQSEAAGVVSLPTQWTSNAGCKRVRWAQSADVVFCAKSGQQPQRIERRPDNSWSVVDFNANDGPFLTENVSNIRLTPSALTGAITLTASRQLFRGSHVGALFRLSSQGQRVESDLVADTTYTNEIRVTGVDAGRVFSIDLSGTWAGTLSLQRSLGEPGSWVTVATYAANVVVDYDDGLDNSIAYYRIGFEAAGYTSGTVTAALEYAVGSITGTVRVTGFTNNTTVSAIVLDDLGGLAATEVWAEGAWSNAASWPEAVAISEGRLWWSGEGQNWASVPDAFTSFDPEVEGDSQPINRRAGEGFTNVTNWLLPLQHLIVGTDGGEVSVRSTSFDEPVTPSNYNAKSRTTKGSDAVPAVAVDNRGYFVGRTGTQLYELGYDPAGYGYTAQEATLLVPEIGDATFVRLAVQQSPDMRLHACLGNGNVALMIRDAAEDVLCWVDIDTSGFIEDVVVLPGPVEDRVFYRVRRTIGGVSVRYHEEWALESQARGGAGNCMADSYVTGTGPITGLGHLEGREVVIWGDSQDRGTATVSAGAVSGIYTDWCVGLAYGADYRSAKLAGQTALGLSLTQKSRIDHIGLILADTHAMGLTFGPSFNVMDDLPMVELGADVDPDALWTDYDHGMVEFPGQWATDNRICLRGAAPRPCTVLAAVLSIDRQDKD